MNREDKLRIACVDAADLFELEPDTFCTGTYAKQDHISLEGGRSHVITKGNAFCALGAISYLSELPVQAAAEFVWPALKKLDVFSRYPDPESFNNDKGRFAVIELLRVAARTEVAKGTAK